MVSEPLEKPGFDPIYMQDEEKTMRTNKWSATVALVTLLLAGGTVADSSKTRAAGAKAINDQLECCEEQQCDCHLNEPDDERD